MTNTSWFYTGEDSSKIIDAEMKRIEGSKTKKEYINRFWIKPASSDSDIHRIIFVDKVSHPKGYDLPFSFKEHQLKINGSFRNWFTCINNIPHPNTGVPQKCPICKAGNYPSLVTAYTIINKDEWTDKKGNSHRDEKQLFVCKGTVAKTLKMASKSRGGSLRGGLYEAYRPSNLSPNTGGVFNFIETVDLSSDIVPYDYREVFAPKTEEELIALIQGISPDGEDYQKVKAYVNDEEDAIRF